MRSDRPELIAHHGFPLDRFQIEAMDVLDAGESAVVAAPTGSGKTVVAEYGIAAALADGRRAFYTAPIKALSNQKYHDLVRLYGRERVGLLTGDNAVNADASVVVMTTEVLRNMIYARSRGLDELACVVLDEVHFIQDTYRGPVWEEVIIHLPRHIQLVCLSATVSNVDEVADWIATVRGPTRHIVEDKRPVELENLFMVGDKSTEREHLFPTLVAGRPNPEAGRLESQSRQVRGRGSVRGRPRRMLYTPARVDVVERLRDEGLLPVIFFIFSRNACDEAAAACLKHGLKLTTPDEKNRIVGIVHERLGDLDDEDLDVLGYPQFVAQLEAGIASHHAGLVPPFKEVVEACFVQGLVKAVFATETLAVGINMPARSVVIEKLSKFTGEHHEFLTAGEYTQLTGRAGRRGLDERGHAVVLWNPFVSFDQVAGLASSRSFRLTSSFRPTYNMAVNLVRSYSSDEARHLLNLSFAQYQADRDVVKIEARLDRRTEEWRDLRESAKSPYGDIDEYRAGLKGSANARSEGSIEGRLSTLRPGDIIEVNKGKFVGRVTVLSTSNRTAGVKLTVVTARRATLTLSARDFSEPPRVLGAVELPFPYAPRRAEFQRLVAQRLKDAKLIESARMSPRESGRARHPVEDDPNLSEKLNLAARADRVAREVEELRDRVRGKGNSVARKFEKVLRILEEWEYVDGWSLTTKGESLAHTFHESDLLIAECLSRGYLDGLDPACTAALTSVFVYEHRSSEPPPSPWFPSPEVRKKWRRIQSMSTELSAIEQSVSLNAHRSPDPTYIAIAYAWASGEEFAEVVEAEELSGGDFVRTMKQLIDLLRQIATIASLAETRQAAGAGADLLSRGVVAASSALPTVGP
ncbi:MAG: DEAD/DEAH box helicase [Actinobacteria bacterium]|nr:DEAD/DEAH box helicase [Actinomycetota bacterium]